MPYYSESELFIIEFRNNSCVTECIQMIIFENEWFM